MLKTLVEPELVEEFISYLKYERNFTKATIVGYKKFLAYFHAYLVKKRAIFSKDSIKEFIYNLQREKGVSARTINIYIFDLKHYCKWLRREDYLEEDETETLYRLKEESPEPVILSVDEVIKLLNADVKYRNRRIYWTYWLIVRLLAFTGMRRLEVEKLNIESVDFANKTIRVDGKGRFIRVIPIPKPIESKLKWYIGYYRRGAAFGDPIFVSQSHKKRLIADSFHHDLLRRTIKAGIKKKVYPHLLRHSFITHLINQGGANPAHIAKLVSHRNFKTTMGYIHLLPDQLNKTLELLPYL